MNEREEFRLPDDLERKLLQPLPLPLPDPQLLARRAIVLSRDQIPTRPRT